MKRRSFRFTLIVVVFAMLSSLFASLNAARTLDFGPWTLDKPLRVDEVVQSLGPVLIQTLQNVVLLECAVAITHGQ